MGPYWSPSSVGGFLLDWDGVIADTKLDFSGVREKYYGGRRAMLLEEAHTLPPETRKALYRDLRELEMSGAEKAAPVPGAFELISWLTESGTPYCVLSRNCMEVIERGAEVIGLTLPEYVWGRDNMEFVKPDPRALLSAAEKIGAAPRSCLYIGDFLYDLQGARRAGMRAVLVQRENAAWACWADAVYPKMTDFVSAVKNKEELVPWEYREIFAEKGALWLKGAFSCALALPERPLPDACAWLARAAALGVGSFYVDPQKILTPDDWKRNPSFDTALMGLSWRDAANRFLSPRFPLARISVERGGALSAPVEASELKGFMEGKVRGDG